ncbi:MAG: hypothetical protein J7501_00625 [Bdellovibrio sp.]|nr:hypothetical protein [Bdellovibrio sp.]
MKKFKTPQVVPFILIFAFAYLAGRAWNYSGTPKSTSHLLRLPQPQTASEITEDFPPPSTATTFAVTPTQPAPSSSTTQQPFANTLASGQGAKLFKHLFTDHELLRSPWSADLRAAVEQRFFTPYTSNVQVEVTGRLGVLKALAQVGQRRSPSSVPPTELAQIYKRILANRREHWLVQRQAFQNLKSSLPAGEITKYYATLDNRVVRLSMKSEPELLMEVLNEKNGSR